VLLNFRFLCVVLNCFVCFRSMSVACVYGLSIPDCDFGFPNK
jgi:hypothetical protein